MRQIPCTLYSIRMSKWWTTVLWWTVGLIYHAALYPWTVLKHLSFRHKPGAWPGRRLFVIHINFKDYFFKLKTTTKYIDCANFLQSTKSLHFPLRGKDGLLSKRKRVLCWSIYLCIISFCSLVKPWQFRKSQPWIFIGHCNFSEI